MRWDKQKRSLNLWIYGLQRPWHYNVCAGMQQRVKQMPFIARLHDQANIEVARSARTGQLVEPASSCKRGIRHQWTAATSRVKQVGGAQSCNFPTEKIMRAQKFNFTFKFPQCGGFNPKCGIFGQKPSDKKKDLQIILQQPKI